MLPGVNINITTGALGQLPATRDGVAGIMLAGPATGSLANNTPVQLFELKDAEKLGIDEQYDTTNSVDVYAQLKEFFRINNVAELWLMLLPQTTTIVDMFDKTQPNNAIALLNAAGGDIRLLAAARVPDASYVATYTHGFDDDAYNAIVKAQELAADYEAQKKPFVAIIGGRDFQGIAGNLTDLHTLSANNVLVSLAGTAEGIQDANVGLPLGVLARDPVQRNMGRVRSGDLGLTEAFLTDGFSVESHESELDAIHDKGYLIYRKYMGKAGYFFNDDPTATALTDDRQGIARNRVINKAILLAYTYFVNEVNEEISLNANGTLQSGYVKGLQSGIDNVLNGVMTANGELSGATSFIDETQDVLSTNKLKVKISLQPVGYAKNIEIELGFEKTL